MSPKSKTEKAVLAAQDAYLPDEVKPENIDLHLPEGGKVLESEWNEKTAEHKFRANVYIDPKNKKVTYAIAGTRVDQGAGKAASDLKDDLKLALGLNPDKMESVHRLNYQVLDAIMDVAEEDYKRSIVKEIFIMRKLDEIALQEKSFGEMTPAAKKSRVEAARDSFDELGEKEKGDLIRARGFTRSELSKVRRDAIKGYEINFTGHSLGAVLSDLAATDMHIMLKKQGVGPAEYSMSSVTFDNPGAHTLVKKMCKKQEVDMKNLQSAVQYKAFNNRDNFINTLDKQVGEKYRIVPDGQKPRSGFGNMCAWLAKQIPIPVVKHFFKFLSFGMLTKQVADHSLLNFDGVLVEGQGVVKGRGGKVMTAEEATTGIEPLEFEKELFDQLSKSQVETQKSASPTFSMTDPETGNRLEFSKDILQEVLLDQSLGKKDAPRKGLFAKKFRDVGKKIMTLKRSDKAGKKPKTHKEKYMYSKKHKKRSAKEAIYGKGKALKT